MRNQDDLSDFADAAPAAPKPIPQRALPKREAVPNSETVFEFPKIRLPIFRLPKFDLRIVGVISILSVLAFGGYVFFSRAKEKPPTTPGVSAVASVPVAASPSPSHAPAPVVVVPVVPSLPSAPSEPQPEPVPADVTAGTCALGFGNVEKVYRQKSVRELSLAEQGWLRFGYSCVGRGFLIGQADGFHLPPATSANVPSLPPSPVVVEPIARAVPPKEPVHPKPSPATPEPSARPASAAVATPSKVRGSAEPARYLLTAESCRAHQSEMQALPIRASGTPSDRELRELRRGCMALGYAPEPADDRALTSQAKVGDASTCTLSAVLVPTDGRPLDDVHGRVEIRGPTFHYDAAVQSDGSFQVPGVPTRETVTMAVRVSHLRDDSVTSVGCAQTRLSVRHSDVAGAISDRLTGLFHRNGQ